MALCKLAFENNLGNGKDIQHYVNSLTMLLSKYMYGFILKRTVCFAARWLSQKRREAKHKSDTHKPGGTSPSHPMISIEPSARAADADLVKCKHDLQ